MILKHHLAALPLASLLVFANTALPLFAQGGGKWFVLRNHEVGNCWTATLARVDGQYTSTFEQKAGGPYDTEAQAMDRQKKLENEGTCNRD
jgi:hypothetical protein